MSAGYYVEWMDFPSSILMKVMKVVRAESQDTHELITGTFPIVLFDQTLVKFDKGDPQYDQKIARLEKEKAEKLSSYFFETPDQIYALFEQQFLAATDDAEMTELLSYAVRTMLSEAISKLPNQN